LQSASWFFLLLGGGFVLTYLVGMRPAAVWPLFPAAVLICLGLVLLGWASLEPVAALSWIVGYWPAALVLVGLWLLFRDYIPPAARAPVATVGGIALLGYGILAAIASVAAAGNLTNPGFMARFGGTPFNDEITLERPIAAGETFTVTNPNGRTVIQGRDGSTVRVLARRHFWVDGQPPEVRLDAQTGGVVLSLPELGRPTFGPGSSVDFDIEVPANVQLVAESSSGALDISDIAGAVQARASSGQITLKNIAGELRANASSGRIRGTELQRVRDVRTSSGSINLSGVFTEPAEIRASSGSVQLTFTPGSAIGVDVRTSSGNINQRGGLELDRERPERAEREDRRSLSGTLGAPAPGATLQIQTSSGNVTLNQ
jgi:hypothetical protein